jgi:hypothetical protein
MSFEKMLAGSQKRKPKQTQSDKIVNATYMKPSKSPQITTDKDSLSCDDSDILKRRMPSARPPPVDASQAEEDNYDEEESEHVHTLSSRLGQASLLRYEPVIVAATRSRVILLGASPRGVRRHFFPH